MIPGSWIKIETDLFPILPDEEKEVVNEGMYGKALCQYIERQLPAFGVEVKFFCSEDWGWWVAVSEQEFEMGLLIHAHSVIGANPGQYAIGASIQESPKWYWSRFQKVDVTRDVVSIMNCVENMLEHDNEIYIVERHDAFPEF